MSRRPTMVWQATYDPISGRRSMRLWSRLGPWMHRQPLSSSTWIFRTYFVNADLSAAKLSGATISGADFCGANLENVDFSRAKLGKEFGKCPDFRLANLQNAKFCI